MGVLLEFLNVFGDGTFGRLLGIDVVDGTISTLAEFQDEGALFSFPAGIAVVPPAPIPTLSAWGAMILTLVLLIGGTLVLRRRRDVGMVQWVSDRGTCCRGYVRALSSPFAGGGS